MREMLLLGLDIGGANTKAALIKVVDGTIHDSWSGVEYFPFWEQTLDNIPKMLQEIVNVLVIKNGFTLSEVNKTVISITAELSDAFQTKEEGINAILDALIKVFEESTLRFITHDHVFVDYREAKHDLRKLFASNWIATALFLGKSSPNCVLVDSGSTTIDLIPIINSVPSTVGKTDIVRLINHELIYTGGLRATIPSITHHVPYLTENVRISFEKFALVADIHRILGNITEEDYVNDTADGRSKSLHDCYARLARTLCMDLSEISTRELDTIASFIYQKQLKLIRKEINSFLEGLAHRNIFLEEDPLFVLTGSSASYLIEPILEELGYTETKNLRDHTGIPDNVSSSAFAVAGAYRLS